jgi:hypothetical protein
MKPWQDGNRWETRSYVTDGAFGSAEPTHGGPRIKAYEDANKWGTRVYVTDPSESADTNLRRIRTWQDSNRWDASTTPAA